MEYIVKVDGDRTVIRIGLHDVGHKVPPLPINGSVSSCAPLLFILNFDISKKRQCFAVQENRVILSAMFLNLLPLVPLLS